ncbi:MAG TPA: hypothetical protein P5287_02815 [bacterium]|nr:hypothetical protein [bacterium]
MAAKNTWGQKIKRTVTSVMPVDSARQGDCKRCGACCSLPNTCPFLRFEDEARRVNSYCAAYAVRPLNCRKYPRVKDEQVVEECGYSFPHS